MRVWDKLKIRYNVLVILFFAVTLSFLSSCKKLLQVRQPDSRLPAQMVFANDATANSALVGIYITMYSDPTSFANGGVASLPALTGLSSDELKNNSLSDLDINYFEINDLQTDNIYVNNLWTSLYKIIYQTNAVLEGLDASVTINSTKKRQLRGEALFVRGFCHFYLVNIFGDVPLITTSDYTSNSVIPRSPQLQVDIQVEKDLLEAETLLPESYISNLRIRPNQAVAQAMLARFYLYRKEWSKAETYATKVINRTSIYTLSNDLNTVFLSSSREAIWQLKPSDAAEFTNEGHSFSPLTAPQNNVLSDTLVNSFQNIDKRRINWITMAGTFSLPYKYKLFSLTGVPSTECSIVLRLAEQYLIRAESRANLGILTGSNSAISDLNQIRSRAGLPDTTATDLSGIMKITENERKLELFTEWGHRWFDLKRWNKATQALASLKPLWSATDMLYPIPQNEITKNPNLKPQNPGY